MSFYEEKTPLLLNTCLIQAPVSVTIKRNIADKSTQK